MADTNVPAQVGQQARKTAEAEKPSVPNPFAEALGRTRKNPAGEQGNLDAALGIALSLENKAGYDSPKIKNAVELAKAELAEKEVMEQAARFKPKVGESAVEIFSLVDEQEKARIEEILNFLNQKNQDIQNTIQKTKPDDSDRASSLSSAVKGRVGIAKGSVGFAEALTTRLAEVSGALKIMKSGGAESSYWLATTNKKKNKK